MQTGTRDNLLCKCSLNAQLAPQLTPTAVFCHERDHSEAARHPCCASLLTRHYCKATRCRTLSEDQVYIHSTYLQSTPYRLRSVHSVLRPHDLTPGAWRGRSISTLFFLLSPSLRRNPGLLHSGRETYIPPFSRLFACHDGVARSVVGQHFFLGAIRLALAQRRGLYATAGHRLHCMTRHRCLSRPVPEWLRRPPRRLVQGASWHASSPAVAVR